MPAVGEIRDIRYWDPITGTFVTTPPTNVPFGSLIGAVCVMVNTGSLSQKMNMKFTLKRPDGSSKSILEAPPQTIIPGGRHDQGWKDSADMAGIWQMVIELYGEVFAAILSLINCRTWCAYCHPTDYRHSRIAVGVTVQNTGNADGIGTVQLWLYPIGYGDWFVFITWENITIPAGGSRDLVYSDLGGAWGGYPFKFTSSWGEVKQGTLASHCQTTPIYY